MENDKSLQTLEEEIKLMKGQLKQSLAGVRDYLLNMELPSSEFATVLAALGGDSDQRITMRGSFSNDAPNPSADALAGEGEAPAEAGEELEPEGEYEEAPEDELEPEPGQEEEDEYESDAEVPEGDGFMSQDDGFGGGSDSGMSGDESLMDNEDFEPGSELLPDEEFEPDETIEGAETEMETGTSPMHESGLPLEEELPMEYGTIKAEVNQSIPKVNLLANLTNWIAKAKKEIGYDQIPTFLEVYGISGHLSPELKEVILNLADITMEKSNDTSTAEIWSQSMLSLHGILTGGNAPLYPLKPSWGNSVTEAKPEEEEIIETEVEKVKEMPVKLKLVFPNGGGKGKEYCINLNPEADDDDSEDKPDN